MGTHREEGFVERHSTNGWLGTALPPSKGPAVCNVGHHSFTAPAWTMLTHDTPWLRRQRIERIRFKGDGYRSSECWSSGLPGTCIDRRRSMSRPPDGTDRGTRWMLDGRQGIGWMLKHLVCRSLLSQGEAQVEIAEDWEGQGGQCGYLQPKLQRIGGMSGGVHLPGFRPSLTAGLGAIGPSQTRPDRR